jgi:hypothetical protein
MNVNMFIVGLALTVSAGCKDEAADSTPGSSDDAGGPRAGTNGASGEGANEGGEVADAAADAAANDVCKVEVERLGFCFSADPGADMPESSPVLELSGMVDEVTRDDGPCASEIGVGYGSSPSNVRYRVHVVDGNRGLWFGLSLPWSTPLVDVGDPVSVRFTTDFGAIGPPPSGAFELMDADGSTLLWLADDYSTMRLAPPDGITVGDGDKLCGGNADCYTFEELALVVTANGEDATLQPGEHANVGPYVAVHAGNQQVTSTGDCTDCCSGHVSVALVRGDLATLDARDRPPCGSTKCEADQVCELPAGASCDLEHEAASCVARPETCEETCPGVCGCDGRFYCNDCWAARAGTALADDDSTCPAPSCESDAAAKGQDSCTVYWLCSGEQLAIQCLPDKAGVLCTCSRDHQRVHSFTRATLPICDSEEAANACGLPWSQRPAK